MQILECLQDLPDDNRDVFLTELFVFFEQSIQLSSGGIFQNKINGLFIPKVPK
jgi:hypothetical protein